MLSELKLAQTLIAYARVRADAHRARGGNQVGASAIEWAIISAVVVGLAIVIYRAIKGVVDDNTGKIEDGSNI